MYYALPEHDLRAALRELAKHKGNVTAAAMSLNIPRSTFRNRLDEARRRKISLTPSEDTPEARVAQAQQVVKERDAEIKQLQKELHEALEIKRNVLSLKEGLANVVAPEWITKPLKTSNVPGCPALVISDEHWGEVVNPDQIGGVNEYDLSIARKRLQLLAERSVHLLKIISPDMNYPGIAVMFGGDGVSGNIHEELQATNEVQIMPAVIDLYKHRLALLKYLADVFGRVFLAFVTGNHGRDTKKIWNKERHTTSFDWLVANFLQAALADDKRFTFMIPEGPDAYFRIYNHRFLLTHGDQFRGGDGQVGALGPIIRGDLKKRSRNMQVNMAYDTQVMGHWHQYIHLARLIVNGSVKGYDEYAYANNFPFEDPQQALFIAHPEHGITFRMPVFLGESRRDKKAVDWVSVPR